MRLLPWIVPLGLAGCAFDPGGAPLRDGGGDSGDGRGVDAAVDDAHCACALGCASDGVTCLEFDPSNLDDFALLTGLTDPLTITPGTWTLDTDAATLRDPGNASVAGLSWTTRAQDTGSPELEVLALGGLVLEAGATLHVTGERALLLLADGEIDLAGTLELAIGCTTGSAEDRDRQWCGGPGGGDGGHPDPDTGRIAATGCGPGGDGDAGTVTEEHGGGGGGHGSLGGHGGGFDNNGGDSQGGVACRSIALEPLGGGGGGGGAGYVNGGNDDSRTAGGGGGGAVQLTSRTAITITGAIDAPGAGGAGTAQVLGTANAGSDGGGGGGAGGAILLEAPTITVGSTAIVTANGGGGGAGVTLDRPGQRGQRARTRALGGVNDDASTGGFGAIGDVDGDEATDGAAPGDGGSGGGGGAGRVHLHGAVIVLDISAVISPVASQAPLFGL